MVCPTRPNSTTGQWAVMKRASEVPPLVESCGVRPVTFVIASVTSSVNGPGSVTNTQAFEWEPSNAWVFVTEPGPFTELVTEAIKKVTGRTPQLSTSGGTSDARFITAHCPVVEFGLVGQTMHQVD